VTFRSKPADSSRRTGKPFWINPTTRIDNVASDLREATTAMPDGKKVARVAPTLEPAVVAATAYVDPGNGATDTGRPPYEMVMPISLSRARVKFFVFAALTVVCAFSGASAWLTLTLMLTCIAIPLAVAAIGGREFIHSLFFIPPKR
jgi:hypothetical protein